MIQSVVKKEEADIGNALILKGVKIKQLDVDGTTAVEKEHTVEIKNLEEGVLQILISCDNSGSRHEFVIHEGRVNMTRIVKNMDPTVLNKESPVEYIKKDGTWGEEPVKDKRLNAAFTFHMRDIKAQ